MSYHTARSYANAYAAKVLAKNRVPISDGTEQSKKNKPSEYGIITALVGFILGVALPLYLKELISLEALNNFDALFINMPHLLLTELTSAEIEGQYGGP